MKTSKLRPLSWLICKLLVLKLIPQNYLKNLCFYLSNLYKKFKPRQALCLDSLGYNFTKLLLLFLMEPSYHSLGSKMGFFPPTLLHSFLLLRRRKKKKKKRKSWSINMVFKTTTTPNQSIQTKTWNSLLSPPKNKVSERWPPSGFAVPASLS